MTRRIVATATMVLFAAALILTACSAPSPTAMASTAPDITPSGTLAIKPTDTASAAVSPSAEATASLAPAASASASSASQTFTGYLIDQKCGLTGIDIQDGTDLTKHPEKHQLSCAMMPGCLASGFGIMMKQSDGTYKFFKFDAAGSKIAIDSIINKTSKQDNFLVDVTGAMSGDTITVTSITLK